jgi:hypothetical protein
MNNFFAPNSPLGSAFNDIFGQATNTKPQTPAPASKTTSLPAAARIGFARQVTSSAKPR